MSKIIIMNGAAGAGKTTFEGFCKGWWGTNHCYVLSTVDLVKDLAKQCGWNGEKTPEARKFLSDFKDFLSDTYLGDITFNDIKKKISNIEYQYDQFDMDKNKIMIFVDAREPEQIQKFKDELNAITVLVRNEKQEQMVSSNHADANVLDFDYDYIIHNNDTLNELNERARIFCQLIKARKN